MELQKIGPLDCLPLLMDANSCVIFFHGYGANAYDLAPLVNELKLKQPVDFYFPDAPLALKHGGVVAGRAWFPIDEKALEQAMMNGGFRDYKSIRPPGIDKAVKVACDFIEEIKPKYENIFLAGFSQGAMLVSDITLQQKIKPKGLILLSGTLLNKDTWAKAMDKIDQLDVFQSHGEQDPVLSYEAACELHKMFEDRDYKIEFHGFRGGHEIPRQVVQQLSHFINYRV